MQLCGGESFVFFFVDPKGWTDVGIPKLSKLARRPRSEFLITFMYDFINRFIGKDELREQVTAMLGELREEDHLELSSLAPKNREEVVVRKYREQLKVAMGPDGSFRPRSYHAVVKYSGKERTKYHMVYSTRHHKGIVKFAEQSEKVEFFQRVVRLQTKQNATHQFALFSAEQEAERQDDAKADLADVKNYWLAQLSDNPVSFNEEKLADMLEATGWLVKDFQEAFGELLSENKVENLDAGRKRPIHHVHFAKKGERLRRSV